MLRGQASGQPAPRGPVQQPSLEKGGLVYSLDGVGVLPAGCGQGIQSHRATGALVYDASQRVWLFRNDTELNEINIL